ncbi:MAG: FAD-dependent oxidoreductase [Acidobacteriales bacterium]|nr:FAD-dependent oxidoreductase [Terriglobales bacterium]
MQAGVGGGGYGGGRECAGRAGSGGSRCHRETHGQQTSYCGGRRGRIRRLDSALSSSRRGAGYAARCLGAGKLTRFLGWGTRVIRGAYGPNQPYTRMAARALELWKDHETQWKQKFFHPIGVLWMVEGDGEFERGSLPLLKDAGIPFEQLAATELVRRWKQINFEKVEWGIWEPQSGYLLARASAQAVVEHFVAEGGEYRQAAIVPGGLESGDWKGLPLSDGSKLVADRYVFACGPWLGNLFPKTVGPHFVSTKQDVFFFGTPAGIDCYEEGGLPVWADHSDHFMYGIPGNQRRGFKLADDTRGPDFDPTSGQRLVGEDRLAEARRYLAYRFPGMKGAPLVESRVCQYENTTDHNFIVDRHPANQDVWIVGGGSGHGFKHGPALGEMVARLVLKNETADALYRLARFFPNR